MTFAQDLANLVASSGKKYFVLGIVGLPYAGQDALARDLVDERASRGITAEHFDADKFYVEMAPGIRVRTRDLARDIQEFKTGTRIFIGDGRPAQTQQS